MLRDSVDTSSSVAGSDPGSKSRVVTILLVKVFESDY